MKKPHPSAFFEALTEEQEQKIGESLVKRFNLKEAKTGNHPRSLKSYDPPRYFTDYGTKTALGIARTVAAVFIQELSKED